MRTIIFIAGTIAYLIVGWLIFTLGRLTGSTFLFGIGFAMLIYPIMFAWWAWLACLVVMLVFDVLSYATRDRS